MQLQKPYSKLLSIRRPSEPAVASEPKVVYEVLLENLGFQGWWPAEGKGEQKAFEIAIGAILTQQASWRNVKTAVENLRRKGLLNARALARASALELEELVRTSGFYRQKARRINAFAKWIVAKYGGMTGLLALPLKEARRELLSFNGIGRETADSILLYAGGKPVFVVDAYTRRLCERLGLLEHADELDYEEVRAFFEENLPRSARIYNEFHALIVELCKRSCKVKPACNTCALRQLCTYSAKRR